MVDVVGQNPNFTTECGRCGRQLQFTRDDVKPGDRLGDGEYAKVIFCPGCGKKISVTMQMGTFDAQEVEKIRRQDLNDDF